MFHIIMTDCVGNKLDERVVSDKDMVQRAVQSIAATMNFGDGDSIRVVYQAELSAPGHTDLMLSPEDIDEALERNPLPLEVKP